MAHERRVVFGKKQDADRLPDWASEGAVMVQWLQQRGLWDEAGQRLRVRREGGYVGLDVLLFLLLYFTSEIAGGFKGFWQRARGYSRRLGAIGGRRQLPSPSSVSRFLAAVRPEDTHLLKTWLLMQCPQLDDLLRHPSTLTRDALGEPWHIFDWDPTVAVLRQRGLPAGTDLPDAQRRSDQMARAGYAGRKRGDVQFSRATLQHAGSGTWTALHTGPGNGEGRAAFEDATKATVATCDQLGVAPSQAIVRADGAAGNVPYIHAAEQAGIGYVTRLAHYDLLAQSNVVQSLNEQSWYDVPSSGSGPRRQAAELGMPLLYPDRRTRQFDGNHYDPVEPRVVVSRFEVDRKRGAGVWINGWQYELFATNLKADAWPTADVVQLYYGRCGQENRFSQEDRELNLDHVFTYNLAGQELVTLVGLFIWNFRIARGMELARPPSELAAQPIANHESVVPTTALPEPGAAVSVPIPDARDQDPPEAAIKPIADREPDQPATTLAKPGAAVSVQPSNTQAVRPEIQHAAVQRPVTGNDKATSVNQTQSAERELHDALDAICDWSSWLTEHPHWHWNPSDGGLRCPSKVAIPASGLVERRQGEFKIRFRAGTSCRGCLHRPSCAPEAESEEFEKQVQLEIPTSEAQPVGELLAEAKRQRRRQRRQSIAKNTAIDAVTAPSFDHRQPRKTPISWRPPSTAFEPGSLAIVFAILLPAALRKLFQRACSDIETAISVSCPPALRDVDVYALTPDSRQQRRQTWQQRLRANQLPDDAHVAIDFRNSDAVADLLRPDVVDRREAA